MTSPNSFLKRKRESMACTDIKAKNGSSALIMLRTFPNLTISSLYLSIVSLGKVLLQKSSPLPKEHCIPTSVLSNPSSMNSLKVFWKAGEAPTSRKKKNLEESNQWTEKKQQLEGQ